ncbi:phospholipid-binding protein [Bordetella genomosp. 1]|uniref:Phospholipid-binding protein n=1 Tax=Bordetella genomosp. 1 TaxID=1395607 RepID=A0A261SUV6_9BORD|nr:BON domain-containing protein [Bordetella genomosp. 1]MDQ8032720.1 BON domain-containing protein [Bordetella sp.]OZI41144.1 phospholipid-binding protein [Bordetella genomosp. 1]OZI69368.1 phospholipid-binding protein [Bordetella genomosp. 1]
MMPSSRTAVRPLLAAAVLAAAVAGLSACAPIIVGGAAATTAVVVTDRRSSGTQLDDQNATFRAETDIAKKLGDSARVNAMVYNGQMLLTGDVPSEAAKAEAGTIAQGVQKVRSVSNQLTVGPAASFTTRSNDTWITSKVKTALLNTKFVPSGTITTTTDKGVVYLMGKVTQAESDYAANAAADVGGVLKVVKLFEIISREEAIRLSGSGSSKDGKAPIESTGGTAAPTENAAPAGDSGVQVMPIK